MIRYEFDFVKHPSETEEFKEASVHELKTLVALFESGGSVSEDELCEKTGVSRARVLAAIALWQEADVIAPRSEKKEVSFFGNTLSHEFAERTYLGELEEEGAKQVAKTIRDNKLLSLIDELAKLMGKPMLTPREIRSISQLSSQCSLSEEYIAVLAAHVKETGSFSVTNLVNRALSLVKEGVMTTETLTEYITSREEDRKIPKEYKRIFGIYKRAFSDKEKEYLVKWVDGYGFGEAIVRKAYDISTINTGDLSFVYMDKLLTDWHEGGCKTVSECEVRYAERKLEIEREVEQRKSQNEKRRPETKKKPEKRYGDFDPEEAFKLAIGRSFNDKMGD